MTTDTSARAVILGMSSTGEILPAAAGRISTQPGTATEIFQKSQDAEKNKNLIAKVTQSGHTSTIEHTVFHLAFENVSVFAEQFLIEFRLASFTVKSRRYVDFSNSGFYVPQELSEKARALYLDGAQRLFAIYHRLTEDGMPKEDARFVLPYCLNSNFFCTVNAREFLNILRAMLYGRGAAFPELLDLGKQLLQQAREQAPGILTDFESRSKKDTLPFPAFPHHPGEKEGGVSLLNHTPNAAKTICSGVLLEKGYTRTDAENIVQDAANRQQILHWLLADSRPRALEAASYTFWVPGLSLSCLTHFARHRMQSIQIPSLLYANRNAHVLPAFASEQQKELYQQAFAVANDLWNHLRQLGVSENIGVYTLLSGNTIDIVTTMNARELLLFFRLRCCNRAQWEIRRHAEQMLQLCRETDPEVFGAYGPSCVLGTCPEGRMSCGRQEEMKKKYLSGGSLI